MLFLKGVQFHSLGPEISFPASLCSTMSVYNEAESLQTLITLLGEVEGTRVTLIGDVMLDRYHHGYANNLNSTAPVPTLRVIYSRISRSGNTHCRDSAH